jgi:hypothetical protein
MNRFFLPLLPLGTVAVTAALIACTHTEEQRVVSVAECLAQMLETTLEKDPSAQLLPTKLSELSEDDLNLAINVVDGVRACRHKVAAQPAPAKPSSPAP